MSHTRDPDLDLILSEALDLLSDDETKRLVRKTRRGDRAALDTLIRANIRGVVYLAKPWRHFAAHARSIEFVDLVQEGLDGLREAIGRFDTKREVKLFSYAAYWIRLYIVRAAFENMNLVQLPAAARHRHLYYEIPKAIRALEAKGIFQPTDEEIAAYCSVTPALVARFKTWLNSDVSLDQPGAEDQSLCDLLSFNAPAIDEEIAEADLTERRCAAVRDVLATISDRDRDYIESRVVAERGDPDFATLQDLGDRYEHSRERARQIEAVIQPRVRRRLSERLRHYGLTSTGEPRP